MPTPPEYAIEGDEVLRYLMSIHLAEHEADFRGVLDLVAGDAAHPRPRDLTICTIAVLMMLGSAPWPIALKAVKALDALSDEALVDSAIGIVNGEHLLVPSDDGEMITLSIATLRKVTEPSPAFVTTIYSCTAVHDQVMQFLR